MPVCSYPISLGNFWQLNGSYKRKEIKTLLPMLQQTKQTTAFLSKNWHGT
jgi:hypothetical protein